MSTGKGPCFGCEKRHVGCHSDCPEYKEFAERARKIKAYLKQNNAEDMFMGARNYIARHRAEYLHKKRKR